MEQNLPEKFEAAVEIVQNMPKEGPVSSSVDEKLGFYSLYKQATVGPCNASKPGFWNMVEKYKWEAWNNLGNMSKEEAMNEYLARLRKKIELVKINYDTEEWMFPDVAEKLNPKFELIGCPIGPVTLPSEEMEKEETENLVAPSTNHKKSYSDVVRTGSASCSETDGLAQSAASALSDAEYCDAVEDDEQFSRSPASSYDLQEEPRKRRSSLKTYCGKVELELKKISSQIEKLSTAVEAKNNTLINVFKKATVYMFVPKGVSWRTVVFFFLWPFIANFIVRFFKRYFRLQ